MGKYLIENKILINIYDKNKESLLINTLSGRIDVLSHSEAECILRWEGKEICPRSIQEQELYYELLERGYLVDNVKQENMKELELLKICRKCHMEATRKKNVVFVITYFCNFACPYCYEKSIRYEEKTILSPDMVDQIFMLHNNDIENITFFGGEPFLPETREIVKYIISKSPDAKFSAITNGYFLDEYLDILKKVYIMNITVTLDGDRKTHNKTRKLKNGEGTYDKIISNIELYLKNNIRIKVRMNISNKNVRQCLTLRESMMENYKEYYERNMLSFELQPIFQMNEEERKKLNDEIFFETKGKKLNPYKYNVMAGTVSPILKDFITNTKKEYSLKYCYCDAEEGRVFYDVYGKIYACILSVNNFKASIGQYYPEYKLKKRSISTRNIESIEKCRICKLKFLCGGGCANEVIENGEDVMKENCRAILNEIYFELPRLFRKSVYGDEKENNCNC